MTDIEPVDAPQIVQPVDAESPPAAEAESRQRSSEANWSKPVDRLALGAVPSSVPWLGLATTA